MKYATTSPVDFRRTMPEYGVRSGVFMNNKMLMALFCGLMVAAMILVVI